MPPRGASLVAREPTQVMMLKVEDAIEIAGRLSQISSIFQPNRVIDVLRSPTDSRDTEPLKLIVGLLKNQSAFRAVGENALLAIARGMTLVELDSGQVLFHEGDPAEEWDDVALGAVTLV